MAIIDPEGLFEGERLAACISFEDVPETAGLYFVRIGEDTLYIGQSGRVRSRIAFHRSLLHTNKKFNYFPVPLLDAECLSYKVLPIESLELRLSLERIAIDSFRPPFNRIIGGRNVAKPRRLP